MDSKQARFELSLPTDVVNISSNVQFELPQDIFDTDPQLFTSLATAYHQAGLEFDPYALELVDSEGKLTDVGLLFSEQNPQVTRILYFAGDDVAELAKQTRITGSLISQLQQVLDYAHGVSASMLASHLPPDTGTAPGSAPTTEDTSNTSSSTASSNDYSSANSNLTSNTSNHIQNLATNSATNQYLAPQPAPTSTSLVNTTEKSAYHTGTDNATAKESVLVTHVSTTEVSHESVISSSQTLGREQSSSHSTINESSRKVHQSELLQKSSQTQSCFQSDESPIQEVTNLDQTDSNLPLTSLTPMLAEFVTQAADKANYYRFAYLRLKPFFAISMLQFPLYAFGISERHAINNQGQFLNRMSYLMRGASLDQAYYSYQQAYQAEQRQEKAYLKSLSRKQRKAYRNQQIKVTDAVLYNSLALDLDGAMFYSGLSLANLAKIANKAGNTELAHKFAQESHYDLLTEFTYLGQLQAQSLATTTPITRVAVTSDADAEPQLATDVSSRPTFSFKAVAFAKRDDIAKVPSKAHDNFDLPNLPEWSYDFELPEVEYDDESAEHLTPAPAVATPASLATTHRTVTTSISLPDVVDFEEANVITPVTTTDMECQDVQQLNNSFTTALSTNHTHTHTNATTHSNRHSNISSERSLASNYNNPPAYPLMALYEVIINAFAHRDWQMQNSIQLEFYHDKLRILSPGKLPAGMGMDAFASGLTAIRNPAIVRILTDLGLMQFCGLGVRKVYQAYRLHPEATEPKFELTSSGVIVTLANLRQAQATHARKAKVASQLSTRQEIPSMPRDTLDLPSTGEAVTEQEEVVTTFGADPNVPATTTAVIAETVDTTITVPTTPASEVANKATTTTQQPLMINGQVIDEQLLAQALALLQASQQQVTAEATNIEAINSTPAINTHSSSMTGGATIGIATGITTSDQAHTPQVTTTVPVNSTNLAPTADTNMMSSPVETAIPATSVASIATTVNPKPKRSKTPKLKLPRVKPDSLTTPQEMYDYILKCIKQNPKVKTIDIATVTNVAVRTVQRRIKEMTEKQLITRIGSPQNGYWEIN